MLRTICRIANLRNSNLFRVQRPSCLKILPLHNFNNISLLHSSRIQFSVVPYKLSDIGEGIKEVVIREWFVKEGDSVNQFDQICEVQSDKASVTITSRYDGIVRKLYHDVDDTAQVGMPLVDIEISKDDDQSSVPMDSMAEPAQNSADKFDESLFGEKQEKTQSETKALATPVVRRIASEMNININKVIGSGPNGRVLKEDLLNFRGESVSEPSKVSHSEPVSSADDTLVSQRASVNQDTVVKLSAYQKAMHKAMTASLQIPHFTYSDEVNMNALVSMKHELKKIGKQSDVKITLMPFMIKAASLALFDYPQINAHYVAREELILLKGAHNIGVAIDTREGLLVPNIKNCEQKSVLEIAKELNDLQMCADDGKGRVSFQQSQLSNGTFSISNIGFLGGTYTKPVIAPPEVAIGAVGRVHVLPRFEEDSGKSGDGSFKVVPTHVMNVSWSADHRVLDGATICRFSNLWKSYLENPKLMLLHLK